MGSIERSISQPILVDEGFLLRLDDVMRETMGVLCEDVAVSYDVNAKRLKTYLRKGKIPTNINNKSLYEMAVKSCTPVYSIAWKNDLTEDFHDIRKAVKALRSEHSEPISVTARAGQYSSGFISLHVKNWGDETADFRATGTLENVRQISNPVLNLLRNSAPDFSFLHHAYFKAALLTIGTVSAFVGAFSVGAFSSSRLGALGYFSTFLVFLVSLIFAGFLITRMYLRVFPSVVFEFGVGARHRERKKFFFAVCGLVLTILVAFLAT